MFRILLGLIILYAAVPVSLALTGDALAGVPFMGAAIWMSYGGFTDGLVS